MAADRARVSYDPSRKWRGLVAQQGRVTVEADWNEAAAIEAERDRRLTVDMVGAVGTPDGGYVVTAIPAAGSPPGSAGLVGSPPGSAGSVGSPPGSAGLLGSPPALAPGDLIIGRGTLYVGGERLDLDEPVAYSAQPDWLDCSTDPRWTPPSVPTGTGYELVYLLACEQEVSAVEDTALADVALGGPDTMARRRILQRFVRQPSQSASGYEAWTALVNSLGGAGLQFDPASMTIESTTALQVSFTSTGLAGPCQPAATGGYLGAENQMTRVMVTGVDATGTPTIVWGFDDASFLYRVSAASYDADSGQTTLTLASAPVDNYHYPAAGQAVELLRDAVQLTDTDYIASPAGFVSTLAAGYATADMSLAIAGEPPGDYLSAATPQLYLRVWQAATPAPAGLPVPLGSTGVAVTLTSSTGTFHAGDFWCFALRPIQPAIVYPDRYLAAPQPPDGPQTWACPLAVLTWADGTATATSCVPLFSGLTGQPAGSGGGCCTVTVGPSDVDEGRALQSLLDRYVTQGAVTVCLEPGTYTLPAPLVLGPDSDGLTLQACQGGVVLQAASQPGAEFLLGLIVLQDVSSVTIRGLQVSVPVTGFSPPASSFSSLPGPNQVLLGAFSAGLSVAIGISVAGSTGLSIEDCAFGLPGPGEANIFGAGIFATGTMKGTNITGCTFECASVPTVVPFNQLAVTELVSGQVGVPPPYELTFGFLQVPNTAVTATFGSPGSYPFTVPAGVTSLTLTAAGAAGGSSAPGAANGGAGALVTATVAVQPGSQLSVTVGAPGSAGIGGTGGGGAGGAAAVSGAGGAVGTSSTGGSGGGGASMVTTVSPTAGSSPPLIVAGGGGGAGGNASGGAGAGGNAGSSGAAGSAGVSGGGAGASSAGGAGGASVSAGGQGGATGSLGVGGAGAGGGAVGGGGGGGGYYGGGGGAGGLAGASGTGGGGLVGGGGGGGSSFVAAGATGMSGPMPTSEAAQVTITYTEPQGTTQLLADAAIGQNVFKGVTVPVLAAAQLGALRVAENTLRGTYGGFWLVSVASPAQQNVLFGQFPVGDPRLYTEFASAGIAALRDGIFMIATAIGQVLPPVPPAGGSPMAGSVPAPTAGQAALAGQALAALTAPAAGVAAGTPLPPATSAVLENLGAPAPGPGAGSAAGAGTAGPGTAAAGTAAAGAGVTMRLDMSDCQVDAVLAGSYSGAGLIVADFTADAGSALVHGNRIRSRFPMGGTALLGGVGEACVTGNVVANEVAPQVSFAASAPAGPLPSYSIVLNPAPTPLGAALDPSGALFGDIAGVAAVAVTGNVFIDPTSLPPRPAAIPAALADWDVLNTVISYGLPAPPAAGPPVVTAITPASGPPGPTVVVSGSGFTGATAVSFGSNVARFGATSNPDTGLMVIVPAGSGTVDVTVTTPAGTSQPGQADRFTYLAVTGVSPSTGPVGVQVTVTGSGFTGATAVNFGTMPGTIVSVAPDGTELTVTAPACSQTVDVTVTTPAGYSQPGPADRFTPQLQATGISPASAIVGQTLTIAGNGFVAGATSVTFVLEGATSTMFTVQPAQVNVTGPGTLTLTVPTLVPLPITTFGGATSSGGWAVPPPAQRPQNNYYVQVTTPAGWVYAAPTPSSPYLVFVNLGMIGEVLR